MSDDIKITAEDLLRKIGAMVVQADISQAQITALQARISELEAQLSEKGNDKK